jgi:hypothetical protein
MEVMGRPVTRNQDSAWSWAEPDDEIAGRVTAGGGFIRYVYEPSTTPFGPSTAPLAVAFWDFISRECGVGTGGLTPARE